MKSIFENKAVHERAIRLLELISKCESKVLGEAYGEINAESLSKYTTILLYLRMRYKNIIHSLKTTNQ